MCFAAYLNFLLRTEVLYLEKQRDKMVSVCDWVNTQCLLCMRTNGVIHVHKFCFFVFVSAMLSKAQAPLSGWTHSRAPWPSQRKENSPPGSRRLLRICCVTVLDASQCPSPPLRIWGSEPDSLSITALAPHPSGPSDPCSTAVHMQRF